MREIEAERDRPVKGSKPSGDACTEKMRRLVKLHGIGAEFATVLTRKSSIGRSKTDGRSRVTSA